jgi:FkbM family methyltransferase
MPDVSHRVLGVSPRLLMAAGLLRVRPAILASLLKRSLLLKRQEIITSEGVFFVDIASNFGYPLVKRGIYEPQMLKVIKECLRPGGLFVDLGANEGYFSVVASKIVGSAGRVFAIEPQRRLQPVIDRNLARNDCQNVIVLPLAISDDSKPLTLHLSPDMNTGSTAAIQTTRYPLSTQKAESITLGELFEQQRIDTCDLLKVDIEGYEYEAILGSPELFSAGRVRVIALELHPHVLGKRKLKPERITSFLTTCGYRLDRSFANTVFASSLSSK